MISHLARRILACYLSSQRITLSFHWYFIPKYNPPYCFKYNLQALAIQMTAQIYTHSAEGQQVEQHPHIISGVLPPQSAQMSVSIVMAHTPFGTLPARLLFSNPSSVSFRNWARFEGTLPVNSLENRYNWRNSSKDPKQSGIVFVKLLESKNNASSNGQNVSQSPKSWKAWQGFLF